MPYNKVIYPFIFICIAALFIFGCTQQQKVQPSEAQTPPQTQSTPQPAQSSPSSTTTVTNNGDSNMQNTQRDAFGYEMDVFQTPSGKNITFHAIKHGSIRVEFDNLEFEIDPVINLNDKKTDYQAFPDADYILVTHEHFDHLDPEAIQALEKQNTEIITNAACAEKLGRGTVMANGDKRVLRENIHLEAVPAYNTTPGREKYHPRGRDNGFILTIDGFRIYIAGDTEDIPEMEGIKNIDVAFLPCNQPFTMTPAQLVHATSMIQPKVVFPYHYGDTSMDELKSLLTNTPSELRIRQYQ
jgi:L-ascorbate metabolism protein UlaG (beta-lactamase superfamily)